MQSKTELLGDMQEDHEAAGRCVSSWDGGGQIRIGGCDWHHLVSDGVLI